jgi:hypothetical protein
VDIAHLKQSTTLSHVGLGGFCAKSTSHYVSLTWGFDLTLAMWRKTRLSQKDIFIIHLLMDRASGLQFCSGISDQSRRCATILPIDSMKSSQTGRNCNYWARGSVSKV